MAELRVSSDWTYRGLRVVTLENRFLRLTILPEAGAKIWQITYKPFDADLLWNNPRIGPSRIPPNSRYDDVWCGGWDELFPNDEVAVIEGESYPDHGELWTGDWAAEPFSAADEVGVRLRRPGSTRPRARTPRALAIALRASAGSRLKDGETGCPSSSPWCGSERRMPRPVPGTADRESSSVSWYSR